MEPGVYSTQQQQQQQQDGYVGSANAASYSNVGLTRGIEQQQQQQQQMIQSSDVEITPDMAAQLEVDTNYESKYVKRQSDMQRTMKRMMPSLFAQNSLPVTTKYGVVLLLLVVYNFSFDSFDRRRVPVPVVMMVHQ